MRPWLIHMTASVALVTARAASAAEHEAEETANLFAGNLGNAIWTLVIFVLVVVVLRKYAWGPILGNLQKREEFIRDSLHHAEKDRGEAEQRLSEYTQKLDNARQETEALLQQARRDAEAARKQTLAEARQEANRMIHQARQEIELARDQAVQDLYTEAGALATGVAGRIIQRELRPEDHWDLIQQSLDQFKTGSQAERSAS